MGPEMHWKSVVTNSHALLQPQGPAENWEAVGEQQRRVQGAATAAGMPEDGTWAVGSSRPAALLHLPLLCQYRCLPYSQQQCIAIPKPIITVSQRPNIESLGLWCCRRACRTCRT